MRVADLLPGELDARLRSGRFVLSIGGFDVCLQSSLPAVRSALPLLYGDYPAGSSADLVDFHVELKAPGVLRHWLRPQVQFLFDGQSPFKPLPQVQAFAMFEWGLNWCIANHAHEYLVVHAAVVERNGRAFIFPGTPGSGKSTLCAALVCRGWRLLSDEMALISLKDGLLVPVPRPVSLKNASIDVIRRFEPTAVFGDAVADTAKGTIAHMRAPRASVDSSSLRAVPFRVVFPRYREGAACEFLPVSKGSAFMRMAENSFNYHVLGGVGFQVLADAIDRCDSYALSYQNLEDAIRIMEELGRGE